MGSTDLVLDVAAMRAAGRSLVAAAATLHATVEDDAAGCGSVAVETAVGEYALRTTVALRQVQARAQHLGTAVTGTTDAIDGADAALAAAAR